MDINQEEALSLFMPLVEEEAQIFEKKKFVEARQAHHKEVVRTITSDGLETTNYALPGDFVVKNLTEAGEIYVVRQDKFFKRYKSIADGSSSKDLFKPVGKTIILELTKKVLRQVGLPEQFRLMASWGTFQTAKQGDFLALPSDKSEIYRIGRKEFFETYGLP